MTRLIILAATAAILLIAVKWAFLAALPYRRLPRHRVRYLRLRLHLRLHPGAGHATLIELWLRWGKLAAFRRSRRARPALSFWERALGPGIGVLDPDRPRALPARACGSRLKSTRSCTARRASARPDGWRRSSSTTPARSSPPRPSTTCSS